jgi:ACR3 family arsenite transporter
MITRENLEKRQILIYAVTLIVAAMVGMIWPTFSTPLGDITSMVIAILLFSNCTSERKSKIK